VYIDTSHVRVYLLPFLQSRQYKSLGLNELKNQDLQIMIDEYV
jgi:hypothetical protein